MTTKHLFTISVALLALVGACNKEGGGDGQLQGNGDYLGSFQASVDGVPKTGTLGISYTGIDGEDVEGEFDLDDTEGTLGGTKTLSGSKNGNIVTWHSTQCSSDTFQATHNLSSGSISFSGTVCQSSTTYSIANGSGTMQASP